MGMVYSYEKFESTIKGLSKLNRSKINIDKSLFFLSFEQLNSLHQDLTERGYKQNLEGDYIII